MAAKTVLVVEDEKDIRELIAIHLSREGLTVVPAGDGEEALAKLRAASHDLLLVDWMLPGMSGLEIAKAARADSRHRTTPILMVTARTEAADIVAGLEAGADDYVTKPFEVPVLMARVRALLRRAGMKPDGDVVKVGNLEINLESYEARCEGKPLTLTVSEFKLLAALIENRGKVFTRDQLIARVQGEGVTVVDRAIDTHVFGLRKKLGPCAEVVETVRGVGYRVS